MSLDNKENISIRLLTIDDVEEWLDLCAIVDTESGENGIYLSLIHI